MYCHIKRTPKKPQALNKWETIYDEQIEWNKVFIKSTKTTTDPKLKWFQIRTLLYNIVIFFLCAISVLESFEKN